MRQWFNARLGVVLIIVSTLAWVAIPVLPWLALSSGQKLLAATVILLVSEVLFWVGIMLVGKKLAQQYRRQLNPSYWWQKYRNKN